MDRPAGSETHIITAISVIAQPRLSPILDE